MNSSRRMQLVAAALLALGFGAQPALAVDSARNAPAEMRLASDERAFMKEAAEAGVFEIAASRLALEKSKSPEVRKLAGMLVDGHGVANRELMALAASKSFDDMPREMSREQAAEIRTLEGQQGRSFDATYVQEVGIKAHQADIRHFESASRSARDADLKAWATKMLPRLNQHLREAQVIRLR